MIPIKSEEDIKKMSEGGKISALALVTVLKKLEVGSTLSDLDQIAEKAILENGAKPSFKRVYNYKYATCININEGVVHGVPTQRKVKKGDLVKIDLGAFYKGFNTDLSYTIEVGTNRFAKFLAAGKEALKEAISNCIVDQKLGTVSNAIQRIIEKSGYSVSRELIGHGVGKKLHEAPEIPGYGVAGTGVSMKEGMVFALEVIYQVGRPEIAYEKDGWTIITKDRSLAGLFEHTVAITAMGPKVLTDFSL
ncbi:MAG: type I methionyl aminopeptidase [Patescibacteria group bacterium]